MNETQIVTGVQTGIADVKSVTPLIDAIAVASGNPVAQGAVSFLPLAETVLQGAIQLTQAGGMDLAQLLVLSHHIFSKITTTRTQWDAMNVKAGLPT